MKRDGSELGAGGAEGVRCCGSYSYRRKLLSGECNQDLDELRPRGSRCTDTF